MGILVNLLRKFAIVPVPLMDTLPQMIRARVILEANRLGIFDALAENDGQTVDQLATRLGISTNGAGVLVRALKEIGYLTVRRGRYSNSRSTKRWLVKPGGGLRNYLRLQVHIWENLTSLGDTIRNGQPARNPHDELVTNHSEGQDVYTRAMRELAALIAPRLPRYVRLRQGATTLLDIGGAHGDYSRALMKANPGLRATVFDLPGPIATAEKIAAESGDSGDSGELNLQAGNALTDDLGTGWDAVLLVNVVHVLNPDQNRQLLGNIFEALAPGGTVFIADAFLDDREGIREMTALYAVNHFNIGGQGYATDEFLDFFQAGGFVNARFKPISLTPLTVAQAEKPLNQTG